MSKLKIELNREGVRALLNSEAAAAACKALASELAMRCGADYAAAPPHKTGQRVAVNVYPASRDAAEDNMENDTLRRAAQSMEILL